MRYVDVFIVDAIYRMLETPDAEYLSDTEFAVAVQDRAAYLAGLSAE